ncbi:MAG TPA: phosphatidylserine decarboxylase family protein [Bacteroidales bacterium]|mgnify:CR=1 FL=1|nr:phosphatidylserine decarboxylase family protein [Bacteroidales bacterium]
MHIHREGFKIIATSAIVLTALNIFVYWLFPQIALLHYGLLLLSALFLFWAVSFFRVPHRQHPVVDNAIVASADGTVVAVEEVNENEYFKDKRIQVSVFMSPFNVHINWFPIEGTVAYVKYHPGKFLIANHPKSSTLNERNTIVVRDGRGREVLVRQIAGLLARRIICFVKPGDEARLGAEFGLIRFGSRVDFLIPADAQVNVKIGEKVRANRTIIAFFDQASK